MSDSSKQIERIPILDQNRISYSEKYNDDKYEYRHVILPKEYARFIPRTHLLTETEWRNFGIQQSPGWEHYLIHNPEPHILAFRRPIIPVETASATAGTEIEAADVVMDSSDSLLPDKESSSAEADENYKFGLVSTCHSEEADTALLASVQFDMALHSRGQQ